MVRDPVELDPQVLRAAEHRAAPVGRRIFDQAGVFNAADEVLEREIHLQARQRPAHTTVNTAAPADVLVVLAFRVESIRVGEPDRVAIGGAVKQDYRRPRGDDGPAHLDVGSGATGRKELDRRLQSERLLDRARDQLGPTPQ